MLPGKATLVSPSGASAPALPMYVWNAVASATWHQLWVNDSEKSPKVQIWYTADQVSCAAGTGTCSIAPAVKLAVGNATWWIQTWNDAGYGPWSDAMPFSVVTCSLPGKAGLVSPSGYVSITKPTFSWRAVPGLPRDGSPIHVRLWSYINGQWYWRDYSFRACNGCS